MPNASRLLIYGTMLLCLMASFATTPFSLGTADLAPDPRLDSFRMAGLEAAFAKESTRQLDLDFEVPPAPLSDLEQLKEANALLKKRVSLLEKRLAELEGIVGEIRRSAE